jgi:hypothetical protein
VKQWRKRVVDVRCQFLQDDSADEQPFEPIRQAVHQRAGDPKAPVKEERSPEAPRERDKLLPGPQILFRATRARSLEEMPSIGDERLDRSSGDRPAIEMFEDDRTFPLGERHQAKP